MRDIHCHILPGVDDGSSSLEESLAMVRVARAAGITSMVCTPHCRSPYWDYDAMLAAFRELSAAVAGEMPLQMGFEVNHTKLVELGVEEWHERLHFEGSDEFLLELEVLGGKHEFAEYERTIYQLQCLGYRVIVAHPERYRMVQKDVTVAERLVQMGCTLQASADFVAGGRFGKELRPAKKLFEKGLYSCIASDAHSVGDYEHFKRAQRDYYICKHLRRES